MPLGIYVKDQNQSLARGNIVILKSIFHNDTLLKRVVACAGDKIDTNQSGVFINGALAPKSKIFQFDSNQNPLNFKPISKILGKDEIFVMGDHIRSFDSRYFGVVNITRDQVTKIKSIITFKAGCDE